MRYEMGYTSRSPEGKHFTVPRDLKPVMSLLCAFERNSRLAVEEPSSEESLVDVFSCRTTDWGMTGEPKRSPTRPQALRFICSELPYPQQCYTPAISLIITVNLRTSSELQGFVPIASNLTSVHRSEARVRWAQGPAGTARSMAGIVGPMKSWASEVPSSADSENRELETCLRFSSEESGEVYHWQLWEWHH